jgi:hypothetical protein
LVCTILLFSGQNDPSWEIDKSDDVEKIGELFNKLPEFENGKLNNSILGYHGVSLKSETGLYTVYNGVVECLGNHNSQKTLLDEDRKLEKFLLNLSKKNFNDLITNILLTEF